MSYDDYTIKQLFKLIKDTDDRKKDVIGLMRIGKLPRIRYDEDLLWAVYENRRFQLLGLIDIKKTLKSAELIAVGSLATATVSIVLSVIAITSM